MRDTIRVGPAEQFGLYKKSSTWVPRSTEEERESEDLHHYTEDDEDRECNDFLKKSGFHNPKTVDEEFVIKDKKHAKYLNEEIWEDMTRRLKKRPPPLGAWVSEHQKSPHEWKPSSSSSSSSDPFVREYASSSSKTKAQPKRSAQHLTGMAEALKCVKKWNEACTEATREFLHDFTEVTAAIQEMKDPRLGDGDGDKYYKRAIQNLDRMTIQPSPSQREFLKMFIDVNLPHIYKHEFLRNKVKILHRRKEKALQKAAFLTCPRRFGKTQATSLGNATLLDVCRGINIITVANSQTIATELMIMTMKNFAAIPGNSERIIFSNQKMCCVTRADVAPGTPPDIIKQNGWFNTIRACSGNARSQRGMSAHLIVLDEAAFINKAMLEEVIGPMIKVRDTIIVALSTSDKSNNWFSKVFNRNDEQIKRLVSRMQVKFICDECEKQGFRSCEHMSHLIPKWHDADAKELIQLFIPNEQLYAQEVLGLIIDVQQGCIFSDRDMERLFTRPKPPIQNLKSRLLLTFIDPKGLSEKQSYFAVCTVLITSTNRVLLVGFDETPATLEPDKHAFLRDYFTALSLHPICKQSTHIITTESNFATESNKWAQLAEDIITERNPGVEVNEYFDKDKKAGAWTFKKNKLDAAGMLLSDFMNDAVYLAQDWVCARESQRDVLQKSFIYQMTNLRIHDNHELHGKNSKFDHDDMAICFLMAVQKLRHVHRSLEIEHARYQAAVDLQEEAENRHGHSYEPWD